MIKLLTAVYHRDYSFWHNKDINIPNGLKFPTTYCKSPMTITELLLATTLSFVSEEHPVSLLIWQRLNSLKTFSLSAGMSG